MYIQGYVLLSVNLSIIQSSPHRLLMMTYMFKFSKGLASVPIPAGCADAVEQSLDGIY